MELLSLCPEKLHCPVLLWTLLQIWIRSIWKNFFTKLPVCISYPDSLALDYWVVLATYLAQSNWWGQIDMKAHGDKCRAPKGQIKWNQTWQIDINSIFGLRNFAWWQCKQLHGWDHGQWSVMRVFFFSNYPKCCYGCDVTRDMYSTWYGNVNIVSTIPKIGIPRKYL